jgi:hypothetical protein
MADDSKHKQDDDNDSKRHGKHHGKGGSGGGGLGSLLGGGILPVLKQVLGSYKHGGRVKKTGVYLIHKGEHVVPAKHRSAGKATRKHTVIKA